MNTHRVYDTHNRRVVSGHRSIRTAVIAADKLNRAVRRANGPSSYLPLRIENLDSTGEWIGVPIDEVHDAEHAAGIC